jgi:hypothetical protein
MRICVDSGKSHSRDQSRACRRCRSNAPLNRCTSTWIHVGLAMPIKTKCTTPGETLPLCALEFVLHRNIREVGSLETASRWCGLAMTSSRVIASQSMAVCAATADPTHPCIHVNVLRSVWKHVGSAMSIKSKCTTPGETLETLFLCAVSRSPRLGMAQQCQGVCFDINNNGNAGLR